MTDIPHFHTEFSLDFAVDWSRYHAALWRNLSQKLKPVANPDCQPLDSLVGIDQQKQHLIANTQAFVSNKGGCHVLLWGARGCGKSSLTRAMLPLFADKGLRMIQIDVQSLYLLEELIDHLRYLPWKFILLCDELSFSGSEAGLPHLKVLLEGSIESVPANVLLYASSNRRHLLPEAKHADAEIEESGEIHFGDSVESTLALADRFGLWLSFYSGNQSEYLAIVKQLLDAARIVCDENICKTALSFAKSRGVYSGRTARHFVRLLQSKAST